jgi:UDP-3-O-[3-hydroxymyristoyl] glucosamine N-acyltransferase
MKFTAEKIAELLNGTVEGNKDITVSSLAKIEEGKPGSLCFIANPEFNKYVYETEASIVMVRKDLELEKPVKSSCTLLRVEDPYKSFTNLLDIYTQMLQNKTGIEKGSVIADSANYGNDCYIGALAYIGENVKIGNNVKIYPHCYIGDNVTIGDNTIIYSGVKIYHECVIGNNCILHASTVIGSDGFGFTPDPELGLKKVQQIGNVVINDYVEIGSNSSIDRATMGSTVIGKGTKLDNLVHIAHNVEVGQYCAIAASCIIAGSTKIGNGVMMGGQVGIIDHVTIADGVKIVGQTGIISSIKEPNSVIQGSPALPIGDFKRSYVMFRRLPKLGGRVSDIEKILKD